MSFTESAKNIIPNTSPAWVSRFAKTGLIAKGIVYCILGFLSFMAAFGLGGKKADKQNTVGFLYEQPFGKVILVLLAIGLLCYTAWRFIQAIKNTEHKDKDAKGAFVRVRYAFSGLAYLALAVYALKIVLNGNNGGNGNSRQIIVSKLLEQPFGQILVGLVAVGFFAAGIYQVYKAYSGNYRKNIYYEGLDQAKKNAFDRAGKSGYTARGIVWGILGYFLLRAAMHDNASEAQGTKEVFNFLQNSGGAFLMGVVALGLMAYGIFMFVRARYEHVGKS
ncbi:MAG: DUF1206 domain-containing protein [Bacteroidia bacterium]